MRKFLITIICVVLLVAVYLLIAGTVDFAYRKQSAETASHFLKGKGFIFDKKELNKSVAKYAILQFISGLYLFLCSISALKFNKKGWFALLSVAFLGFLYGSITLTKSILAHQMMSPVYRAAIIVISVTLFGILTTRKAKTCFGLS